MNVKQIITHLKQYHLLIKQFFVTSLVKTTNRIFVMENVKQQCQVNENLLSDFKNLAEGNN